MPDLSRLGREELAYRLRQQRILAEMGRRALAAPRLSMLFEEAARRCTDGVHARFCRILEYLPAEDKFLVRAGVGWKRGYVGSTMGSDNETPAGHVFDTGRPMIANNSDGQFYIPRILADHEINSSINVLIPVGAHRHWGIVGADNPDEGTFDEVDTAFLEGVAHLLGAAIDREEAAAALRQSEQRFRVLADSLPHLAWSSDEQGSITWFNRRWYEFTGATVEESLGWGWLKWIDLDGSRIEKLRHTLETGTTWENICTIEAADGSCRHFLSRAEPIRDENGKVVSWVGTNTDITQQKMAEDLQRMLAREASHRVKNSLALVASLLNLEAGSLTAQASQALKGAISRVYAVAAVHDQLWRQTDFQRIDLAPFLTELCSAIAATSPQHETFCQFEAVMAPANLVTPLGISLNELITNAYKYAYPNDSSGEVRITGSIEDGSYRLIVSDLGQGLPDDFDPASSCGSLGMRIIKSLARQMNADLTIHRTSPGTSFSLLIPLGTRPAAD